MAPLLARVAAGDRAAAGECVARYGSLVWSLARRHSPSDADAEDAVQEIFIDVWKSAARYDPACASEVTFVAMIARRRLIDRRRSARRRDARLPQVSDVEPVADAPSGETWAEARLASRAVDTLRPDQREVLLLATCQGLSHEEIARTLGMPLGTVKSHARRALMAVREALGFGAAARDASEPATPALRRHAP